MPLITEDERTEFDALYKRLLRERFAGGLISSDDELAFCHELKLGAMAGDVPHGGEIHHVAPDSIDYTNPATIATVRRPAGLTLPQMAVLVALVCAFIAYVLVTVTGLNKSSASHPVGPSGTITPARAQVAGTASMTSLPAPTVAVGFVTVAGEVLPAVRPNTLELAGRSFLVYVAPVKDGNWNVHQDAGIANWVPGSIVNWSFAIYMGADESSQTWVEQLQPGAQATVRVADGQALPFRVTVAKEISRSQTEYLDPHRPGLTIIVKHGDGDKRLLLQGTEQYDTPSDATPALTVSPQPTGR